jgi:hypothetical protein
MNLFGVRPTNEGPDPSEAAMTEFVATSYDLNTLIMAGPAVVFFIFALIVTRKPSRVRAAAFGR